MGSGLEVFTLYLALGVLAGVVAGLFGIGGGAVVVPVLIVAYTISGYDPVWLTHLAMGTSLATISVTSFSAIVAHQQKRAVLWPLVFSMVPGIILGAMLGGLLAGQLDGRLLQICFGIFLVSIAVQMNRRNVGSGKKQLPSVATRLSVAGLIGGLSGIFGIGGGSLTVPFFSWCGIPMARAVACSAALGFPISVSAALTYIATGWAQQGLPAGAYGYVHVPAFFGIILTSTVFARVGAKWAHLLPEIGLQRAFAVTAFALGLVFIVSNIGI